MKKLQVLIIVLLTFIIIIPTEVHAQTSEIDSLKQVIDNHKAKDTTRVNLLNKAASKIFRSEGKTCIQYAKEARELSKKLNFKPGEAESLYLLAKGYYYTQKYDSSVVLHKKSIDVFKTRENKKRIADNQISLGEIYLDRGNFIVSLDYYEKALAAYTELQLPKLKAVCYGNIANISSLQGKYPKALEFYQKVLKVGEETQNTRMISRSYGNIGTIYSDQNDFDKALENFNKAYEANKKAGNKTAMAINLGNIGVVYVKQKKYDEAFKFLQQALDISIDAEDDFGKARYLTNIGVIYREQGNYAQAISHFKKALGIFEKLNVINGESAVLGNITETYIEMKQYAKALPYGQKSLEIAQQTGSLNRKEYAYSILTQVYKGLKQHEKALEYYENQISVKDSIFNEGNLKKLTRLEAQYEHDKEKQALIAEQQKKEALQLAETTRQKQLRNVFIIGALIFLILTLIIFRSLIQKRKANRLLAEQKAQIENTVSELKTTLEQLQSLTKFKDELSQMLVHDLKNPISAIMNLPKNKNFKELKAQIQNSALKMHNLVMNILDVRKYEDSKLTLHKTKINLLDLWVNAIGLFEYQIHEKNISVRYPADIELLVRADKELMERVFINLLSNSLKYTKPEGYVEFKVDESKGKTVIEIRDNGVGIPKNDLNRIFEKYGQSGDKISYSSGLGLTFCKIAVEQHGGSISIKSQEGKETCVFITLPDCKITSASIDKIAKPMLPREVKLKNIDLLKPFLSKLKQTDIYEISQLRKLLKNMKSQNLGNETWVKQFELALKNTDESKYRELIDILEKA